MSDEKDIAKGQIILRIYSDPSIHGSSKTLYYANYPMAQPDYYNCPIYNCSFGLHKAIGSVMPYEIECYFYSKEKAIMLNSLSPIDKMEYFYNMSGVNVKFHHDT